MRGFAMIEPGKTGFIDKEDPKVGPRDALIRPLAVAPCTSDIHTVYEDALGPRQNMILGHEACGVIVEVGSEVKDFKPGDKVLVPAITPNWSDVYSQAGYATDSDGMLGGWKFSNIKDGVFGTRFHVNDADGNLAHLPAEIDPAEACMLSDMIPTGLHASEMAGVTFGDTVAVIGIGPVGLMALRGAVLHGAGRVFAVGSRAKTVEVAKQYGATDIIDYHNGDIADQILAATNGVGVDKVLIAGGDAEHTFADAVKMLKPGGSIGNVNYLNGHDNVVFNAGDWGVGMGHKTIHGGLMPGGRLRMEKLAALVVNGRIDPSLLITHRFEGFEKIPDAIELMHHKPADLIKPVVICNDID
ncbi:NAD(P)-dependent alcohol dehydrogenase [Limosilactobacillus equigenerosi]|uniref:Alcohol dehydrogenase n=1 Tax=Limosilactobacillus equigenerosi DSM 18793 = JCM 14505 TaxID=1423742 RepID=A0A0R1UYA8_9LACO|nr:NAD(P)-dependent alcohol dehydrogenase [Limosilactobacillus equigenerosi]KRL96474.1 alcohol dehydrogenase [Limosilactobacillus equigenerosi DSM 18793 = JCM 14505]